MHCYPTGYRASIPMGAPWTQQFCKDSNILSDEVRTNFNVAALQASIPTEQPWIPTSCLMKSRQISIWPPSTPRSQLNHPGPQGFQHALPHAAHPCSRRLGTMNSASSVELFHLNPNCLSHNLSSAPAELNLKRFSRSAASALHRILNKEAGL